MSVPYTFASATTSLPLSQLDSNFSYFADAITVSSGNVGIGTNNPVVKFAVQDLARTEITSVSASASAIQALNNARTASVELRSYASILSYYTGSVGAQAERMRIDSSGSVLVGTTAPGLWGFNCWGVQTANGFTVTGHAVGTASGTAYAYFDYNNGVAGAITQNGTTGVLYGTSSDYRLKENVQNMTGALDRVAQLKPVTYQWKSDGSDGEGFIAHELAEVCPLAVSGEKDAVDEDGNIIPQGIDPSKIVSLLTAAIQELKTELDFVKSQLTTLQGN